MYGYNYVLVSRGLYDQPRSAYTFEPGEPDDLEFDGSPRRGTLSVLVAYALVIAVIMAMSWVLGSDVPSTTDQARRVTNCAQASDLWSGCLPAK